MKKVLISFGNEKYYKSLDLLEKTSIEVGKVDQFVRYTQDWLKTTEFYKKNQFILLRPRGAGYWIWKPFIILETFNSLQEGDTVMYSDAGLSVIDNLNPLYEMTQKTSDNEIMLFQVPGGHLVRTWTKRDAYVLTDCDEERYYNHPILNGALSLWVKGDKAINFLTAWQRYLRDPRIVTDDPNMCGRADISGFKEHRHDQSVLSLMGIKNNLKIFRDPTQWGNDEKDKFPECEYNQLFNHHRGQI